ncbi:S8 family peptidase [Metabacillus indicus]|uniref:S8 family peptidase n=1 Tax=Metabacillus indicus TaxID=246786 RepID=UPI00049304B7|nr:S8 family peptidase [Metabacillus indicus]KEZ52600.1 serine protease [Metabacillus indicus LMG 22858]
MRGQVRLLPHKYGPVVKNVKTNSEGVEMIQAPKIWEKGVRGRGITIAVLDTGCDINHPDLRGNIAGGRNFTTDDNGDQNRVNDYHGHGTHVAGTIAASKYVGVAPQAKILVVKVLAGDTGSGEYDWIVKGILYAIEQKVDVISMSLGGPSDHSELRKAVKKAVANQISVVCAAGNEGDQDGGTSEYSYPGSYNEVISVGSVGFNRASSPFSNSNNELDLVAPGERIVSTIPGGEYAAFSGTSMATPHVSGALALIKELEEKEFDRTLTEAELYAQLIKRTIPYGNPKTLEGNGLLYLTAPDLLRDAAEGDSEE